jgi:DNA-binding response OmpR family regulator
MDIMMPFMDGWDIIEEISKRGLANNVVISILTAKGTTEHDNLEGLQPYIYENITKPFDVKKLISNVGQMIAM